VMGLMGAKVEWSPYSITITGPKAFGQPLKGIDHDCNDIPDAAMTLAVAALFAEVRAACHSVSWCFLFSCVDEQRHTYTEGCGIYGGYTTTSCLGAVLCGRASEGQGPA
jgi:hypothetical protein